ncbi:retrovirus-related pol polyprotein from transposon TNT 1-94 [Tanacetum coccineum]
MVQDGKVVVQDVRGRYNANNQGRPFQRNNARGNGVAGNVGGEQVTNVDDVMWMDSPRNDFVTHVDHVFEDNECDALDSDVTRVLVTTNSYTMSYMTQRIREKESRLLENLIVVYQWDHRKGNFALGKLCPLTKVMFNVVTGHPLVSGLRLLKTYDGESFQSSRTLWKSSSGQFCDYDLEVAFRKHTCFVRDINAVQKYLKLGLNKTVSFIRTDNGTEFVNQVMSEYYEGVGIFHQKSVPRTPQQNGVVKRRNRTLMEAARTMMIFLKAPMISVGYAPSRKGYRIYNKRTRRLMETIHVTFDEMHQSMAPVRISSGPELSYDP